MFLHRAVVPIAVLPELLAQLGRGSIDSRCRTIASLGRMRSNADVVVPRLIEQFDDTQIRGTGSSAFGPTGNDPGRDFPVALAAVDALVQLGEPARAPILEILKRADWSRRRYHAMLVAGRLRISEAIPYLEATIAAQDTISIRVNFDQSEDYPLHEAALVALRQLGRARALATLDRIVRARDRGRGWAVHTLAGDADAADTVRALLADNVLSADERRVITARVHTTSML